MSCRPMRCCHLRQRDWCDRQNRPRLLLAHRLHDGRPHTGRTAAGSTVTVAAHAASSGRPACCQAQWWRLHKPWPWRPPLQPGTAQARSWPRPSVRAGVAWTKPASSGRPCRRQRCKCPRHRPLRSRRTRSQPGTTHIGAPRTASSGPGTSTSTRNSGRTAASSRPSSPGGRCPPAPASTAWWAAAGWAASASGRVTAAPAGRPASPPLPTPAARPGGSDVRRCRSWS